MHKFGKKVKLEGAKKKKRSDDSESDTDERISKTLKTGTQSRPTGNPKPKLPKFSTMESERDEEDKKLAKAEVKKGSKATGKRSNVWDDEEIMLMLLGFYHGMSADEIYEKWPHELYPRTGVALKGKITAVKKHLFDLNMDFKDSNDVSNGMFHFVNYSYNKARTR
jgi:hypothetical protein